MQEPTTNFRLHKLDIIWAIHRALHDGQAKKVVIAELTLHIKIGRNCCRYVIWDHKVIIQQDPSSKCFLGRAAASGSKVSRILRSGRAWGYVKDTKIVDSLGGE